MVTPNYRHQISGFRFNKNGAENKPKPMFNNTRTQDRDYFLEGFLAGFRQEIDRKIEQIRKEEKMKKINDVNINIVELRRIISDTVGNEVNNKLEVIKNK